MTQSMLIPVPFAVIADKQSANISLLDFSISADKPSPSSVTPGESATSTITIQSATDIGSVDLSASGCTSGLNCQFNPNPVQVTALSSATSTLTITTSSSTPPGTYAITVTGSCSSLTCSESHSASPISLTVTDFSISASPSALNIPAGFSQASQFTLTSLDGFSGTINLSTSTTSSSLAMACESSQILLSSGGSGIVNCNFTPAYVGSYTGMVKATSGSLSHSAVVSVTGQAPPDFTILASPSSLTIPLGSSQDSRFTLTSVNGFAGTVNLSPSTTSSNLAIFCDSSQTTLAAGGTSYVTCSFRPSTVGSYTAYLTASSGSISHTASVSIVANTQPDFMISASPQSFFVQSGSTNSTILTLTGVNNFNGEVKLNSSNSNTTLSSTSVTLSPGVSATVTLNFTGTSPGTSQVTVTAVSKSITHSTTITVAVWDFSISGPSSINTTAGVTGSGSILIKSLGGFSGTVSLSLIIPQGVQSSLSTNQVSLATYQQASVSLRVSSNRAGTLPIVVVGTSRQLSHSTSVPVTISDFTINTSPSSVTVFAGDSISSIVILTSLNGFCCSVDLSALASAAGLSTSFDTNPVAVPRDGTANSTITITIDKSMPAGAYHIDISAGGSGVAPHGAIIAVTVVTDFSISMNPGSLSIPAGASASSHVTVQGSRSFSGNVTISATTSGTELGLTLSQETVALNVGQSVTVTLTVSSSSDSVPGTYPITVAGSSGTQNHNVSISLILTPGPQISVPSEQTAVAGFPIVFKVNATDADTSRLITLFVSTSLPPGATFTAASYVGTVTGIFNWIPTQRDVGSHNITFTVNDGHGGKISAFVIIKVVSVAKPVVAGGLVLYSIIGVSGTGAGLTLIGIFRKRIRALFRPASSRCCLPDYMSRPVRIQA